MPDSIARSVIREVEPLSVDHTRLSYYLVMADQAPEEVNLMRLRVDEGKGDVVRALLATNLAELDMDGTISFADQLDRSRIENLPHRGCRVEDEQHV